MTDRFAFLRQRLKELESSSLLRNPAIIESAQGPVVTINSRQVLLFCSNNYLGLADHPKILSAVQDAISIYGFGSCASRLVSGSMRIHRRLEDAFAAFFKKESALLFPSGWTANEGVITALCEPGDTVLIDKLDHASIIDAVRSTGAQFHTFRRNALDRLDKYLSQPCTGRKYIITESIFSMDGDCADLAALVELRNKHNAILIVDEAHAAGCLGPNGAGLADQLGLMDQVDIVVATLSKAFASNGGIVACSSTVRDYLVNKSRSFIYTTAPSVATCAAALAALQIASDEPQRRIQLADNAALLRSSLNALGLDTAASSSHIVPVIIGPEENTLAAAAKLFEMGYFICAIRPPTVAPGSSRLRISLQASHTPAQVNSLCQALADLLCAGVLNRVR